MSCRKECPTQRNVAAGPGAAVKCRRLFTLNKAPKQRQLLQLQLSRGKKKKHREKSRESREKRQCILIRQAFYLFVILFAWHMCVRWH